MIAIRTSRSSLFRTGASLSRQLRIVGIDLLRRSLEVVVPRGTVRGAVCGAVVPAACVPIGTTAGAGGALGRSRRPAHEQEAFADDARQQAADDRPGRRD